MGVGNRLAVYVSQVFFKRIVFGITVTGASSMCLTGTWWAPWCALGSSFVCALSELRRVIALDVSNVHHVVPCATDESPQNQQSGVVQSATCELGSASNA